MPRFLDSLEYATLIDLYLEKVEKNDGYTLPPFWGTRVNWTYKL